MAERVQSFAGRGAMNGMADRGMGRCGWMCDLFISLPLAVVYIPHIRSLWCSGPNNTIHRRVDDDKTESGCYHQCMLGM